VQAAKLVEKLLKLRVFGDEAGKMNRSLQDVAGGLLVVSQFTLAADTSGGNRPSFGGAAPAALGRTLYEEVLRIARPRHAEVQAGIFGADMQLHLVNDGPVTIPLRVN
jgi:D-tyrosyl-tRNA(Tyr) deacylase